MIHLTANLLRRFNGSPLKTFKIENGWKFGIDPSPAFDVDYYLNNNPDVKNAGLEPLSDYVQRDWSDFYDINSNEEDISQDPHPLFSTEFVKATNIDKIDEIVTKGNLTSSPLEFYLDSSDLELDSEVRFTHPVSISENQVKFTTFINAQSEGFEYAQFEFEKLGINLTPQENGQILVAQSIGIDPIEELINAVKYTVLAGGTYLFSGEIVEDAQTIFEFATETLSYATLSFTPEDISIAPLPFPGEAEAPITIESFPKGTTVEEILGTADNIFSTPLEPIDELANSTESFPQRDSVIENLLNGGIFEGGQEIPQGTYILASNSSGGLYGYDPNELGNAGDWNTRIQQDGSTTDSGVELPNRTPNSVKDRQRAQASTQAEREAIINEPTYGLFYPDPTASGGIRLKSGSNSTSNVYREKILLRDGIISKRVDESLKHVEGNAATIMREFGITEGTVFINHELGPCKFCRGTNFDPSAIEEILLIGQSLTVIYVTKLGDRMVRTFNGKTSQ